MDAKLTLKLDKQVIEQAKKYAKAHKVSLSRLIENYLKALTGSKNNQADVGPLVKDLTGVVKIDDRDYKADYTDYLGKKYR